MEHTQLVDEFETDQLVCLTITDSGTGPFSSTIDDEFWDIINTPIGGTAQNVFYSEILPEYVVTEINEENEEVNGIERVTSSSGFRAMAARFYLKTEQKNIIAKYLQRCDTVTLTDPSGTRTALERVVPEIQKVGVNLFQVDIVLKYEITNYYPENTL
jgi:hypothetical protein